MLIFELLPFVGVRFEKGNIVDNNFENILKQKTFQQTTVNKKGRRMIKKRIELLQNRLEDSGIDVAIFFDGDINIRYFCDSSVSCLVVPAKDSPFALADISVKDKVLFHEIIKSKVKGKVIGINWELIATAFGNIEEEFRGKKFKDIRDICLDIRSIKDKDEIANIRKSCKFADETMTRCIRSLKSFETEQDVISFIKKGVAKSECEWGSLWMSSGDKTDRPMTKPMHSIDEEDTERSKKKLNGFVFLGLGVKYKAYGNDVNRTAHVGNPSKEEREIYNCVLDIQKKCIGSVGPNIKIYEVFKPFENLHRGWFLCHGIGLEMHELPNIQVNKGAVLKKDMVITIESACIFKNSRIHIGDTLLITDKGYELLTKTIYELT